ncbi:MAG TPA: hypothetical protein VFI06_13655 [Chitinophagaceae bacterium]|nr:hypothetical protein [Chitinophagaceae bacterium]
MKPFAITIFITFFCVTLCNSQASDKPKIALSFELGKTGLIYNLNFDYKFAEKDFGFHSSVGSNFGRYLNAKTFGGGVYYLAGKKSHFLEIGADLQYLLIDEVSDDQKGLSFVYPNYSIKTLFPGLNLGYRVYGRKTLFRVGFSSNLIKSDFVPGGYISYGVLL